MFEYRLGFGHGDGQGDEPYISGQVKYLEQANG